MAWWVFNSKFLSERILLPSSTKLHLKKFENAKHIHWKYIKSYVTSCLIYHSSLPTSPTIYTVDSTAICSRCPCSPSSPENKNILAHIWSCKYFEYSESLKPWAGIIKSYKRGDGGKRPWHSPLEVTASLSREPLLFYTSVFSYAS